MTRTEHETTIVADDRVATITIVREFDAPRERVARALTDPRLYRVVRAPERLVWRFTFEAAPEGISMETMTFVELPDGRTRLTGSSVVESLEIRDHVLAGGIESGVVEGYEELDKLLGSPS